MTPPGGLNEFRSTMRSWAFILSQSILQTASLEVASCTSAASRSNSPHLCSISSVRITIYNLVSDKFWQTIHAHSEKQEMNPPTALNTLEYKRVPYICRNQLILILHNINTAQYISITYKDILVIYWPILPKLCTMYMV